MGADGWGAVHLVLGWGVVVSNGLAGLWALGGARWAAWRHRSLWWLVGAAWAGVFVQLTVGVVLMQVGDVEAPAFHVFYGVCCAAAVMFVFAYRQQLAHRRYELFGLGSLFIMGLALRAMFLGG